MNEIKLGYAIDSANEIKIKSGHMVITGVSNLSGKTTALESFLKSSGNKAVVFSTKIGEKSFLNCNKIRPLLKEKNDWQTVQNLIESTMNEKIGKSERSILITLCKETKGKTLLEFKSIVDSRLKEKISTFEKRMLINLQAYLEIIVPKIHKLKFSESLDLKNGINVINLERFDDEIQNLIISNVLDEVLNYHDGVTIVIPEAWKFLPQNSNTSCKKSAERFIRQSATNENYLWIDSQSLTGVDKNILKQMPNWILGYQSEKNEVRRTIDQIPLPKEQKPHEDQIMMLGKGMFIYASRDITSKIYAQPFWLDDDTAIKIATGKISINDLDVNKIQRNYWSNNKKISETTTDNSKDTIKKEEDEFATYRKNSEKTISELKEKLDDALYENAEMKMKLTNDVDVVYTSFGTEKR